MSNLIGMDVAAMSQVAVSIDVQARRIQAAIGTIDGLVQQIAQDWRGPAAREFVGWWQGQHRPSLLRAEAALSGLAQAARNNISQQNHASGVGQGVAAFPGSTVVSGASVLGASVAASALGSAAAGAAAAGGVSGANSGGTDPARAAVVASFVSAYPVGSSVGPPHTVGQCVGLFEEYSMHYVHTPEVFLSPFGDGACDLYTHFNEIPALLNHYTQLPPSAIPQAGDVAVWDATTPYSEGYGHVAIVTGASGSTVHVLEQNTVPNQVSTGSFQTSDPHLLGYLRPTTLT